MMNTMVIRIPDDMRDRIIKHIDQEAGETQTQFVRTAIITRLRMLDATREQGAPDGSLFR